MHLVDRRLDRRAFLARIGVLGAATAAGGLLPTLTAAASAAPSAENPLGAVIGAVRPLLAELARDTLNGLIVMVCPGPDPYSAAQGTPRTEPGGIEARGTDFIIKSLDEFVPFQDQLAGPLTRAIAVGLADTRVPLPVGQLAAPLETLDAALLTVLENDETLPLSEVVALLLNLLATTVNPAAVDGLFLSPFARLTYAEKCQVFELMERTDADLVAMLDAHFPEPIKQTLSGILKFLAGALLEFSAYGSYGEWGVFDPATKSITQRPVGWELGGYQPEGVVHGWADFVGYYQDRRKVENV